MATSDEPEQPKNEGSKVDPPTTPEAAGLSIRADGRDDPPTDLVEGAPGGSGDGSRRTLRLPVRLRGRWRRGWRLGKEMVGTGHVVFAEDHVRIEGRRAGPIRSSLWTLSWIARWALVLLAIAVVVPTSTGLAVRLGSEWILYAPLLGLVCVLPSFLVIPFVTWRLFQPRVREELPWSEVQWLTSDNRVLLLQIRTPSGVIRGSLKPRRAGTRPVQRVLAAIRSGALPAPTRNRLRVRPLWLDRTLQLGAVILLAWGAWVWREPVADWLIHLDEDPARLVPDRMPTAMWEARRDAACVPPTHRKTSVTNSRDGAALLWRADLATGERVAHVRWRAGTRQLGLVEVPRRPEGRLEGFFTSDDVVGLTLVVASADWADVQRSVASRGFDGLQASLCEGRIVGLDVTVDPGPDVPDLAVARDRDTLVVKAATADDGVLLLPIRRRDQPGVDWFHHCELPTPDGRLLVGELREERRYPGFFEGREDQARVYAFRRGDLERLASLESMGTPLPCVLLDTLVWSGVLGRAVLQHEEGGLYARARDLAASEPMVAVGDDGERALDRIAARYRTVIAELGADVSDKDDAYEVTKGFLDAVRWGDLLDLVSFQGSLPLFERTRQRLSGTDPSEQAGQAFLVRLAEEFLSRVPADRDAWTTRVEVAESWLAVEAESEWTLNGRLVRVPEAQIAGYYNIIGRFIIADVGRRVEAALDAAVVEDPFARLVQLRLTQHDIVLDVDRSSTSKALGAWATGDFEYVLDRAFSRAVEGLRDEEEVIRAAAKADYRLVGARPSGHPGVRYADLHRNGGPLGWVALMDGGAITMDFHLVSGVRRPTADSLLSTSGSYVTAQNQTAGLAVIDGRPHNFLVTPNLGGIVICWRDGVFIGDLREGMVLPGRVERIQPLQSLGDFVTLIDWLDQNDASAFQTHVLASDLGLSIDASKARPDLRERRLLVTGVDPAGRPVQAIVDIPGNHRQSLFAAAVIAYAALSIPTADGGPGLRVTGIANLDVGSYDILEARTAGGEVVRRGPRDLSIAHNLLTFRPR